MKFSVGDLFDIHPSGKHTEFLYINRIEQRPHDPKNLLSGKILIHFIVFKGRHTNTVFYTEATIRSFLNDLSSYSYYPVKKV